MPNLYVVFVAEGTGVNDSRLERFLQDNQVAVSKDTPVTCYPADGKYQEKGVCFVFCRDTDPPAELITTVTTCRSALGDPQGAVFFHANSERMQFAARQRDLRSKGRPLNGLRELTYSRSPKDPAYDALLKALFLLKQDEPFIPVERLLLPVTTVGRVARIQHQLSHLLLPIAIDVQGLAECQFADTYWREVEKANSGVDMHTRLKKVRAFITGPGSLETIAEDARSSDIHDSVRRLLDLLSPADPQYATAVQPLLKALGSPDGAATVKATASAFLEWHARFAGEWDGLIARLEEAAAAFGNAERPAEKEPTKVGA